MTEIDSIAKKFNQYYKGLDGVEKDYKEAYKYAKKAVEQDSIQGTQLLAICYEKGVGVEVDMNKAISLYSSLVDKDVEESMVSLGLIYNNSSYDDHNYQKAVDLFTRASELGNVNAMVHLANMYYISTKDRQFQFDFEKAAKYYKLAADKGDLYAAEKYADMLVNGIGVTQNKEEALRYYNIASPSEKVMIKIELLKNEEPENELIQKVNEKLVKHNKLKRLKSHEDEIDWEWGDVFYFK
ncbi:hypothetical protein M9Y10_029886 [Tritrichomonas musculus]|uniref:Beta-lactamase n=1 Tax=Tritrichomonas musculus TaxID=1915356 RepID=A0ABR2KP05_9EUKA